jgi:hypothetical protein
MACPDEEKRRADHLTEDEYERATDAMAEMGREKMAELVAALETMGRFNLMVDEAVGRPVMTCNMFQLATIMREAHHNVLMRLDPLAFLASLLGDTPTNDALPQDNPWDLIVPPGLMSP